MIRGRAGQAVTIVRTATVEDVQKFERRAPGRVDFEAIHAMTYVIARDSVGERLYHIAYLRADGGSSEINAAIRASLQRGAA